MRRRLAKQNVSSRFDTIRVKGATRLVTLESPDDDLSAARGAFCRLRPSEDMTSDEVSSWRESVAAIALAVKVLPTPKAAEVPDDLRRPGETVGTIREEAMRLAEETGDKHVVKLVTEILNEVGCP